MRARWAWTITVIILVGIMFSYTQDELRTTSVLSFSLRYAIPLIIAAMVGLVCERSGVINIGIEGQLLMSAFAGFFGAAATGSLIIGTLFGIGTGLIMGAVFATGAVAWKMDQIISGTIINIIATGLTSFFYAQGQVLPASTPVVAIPYLKDLPLVGPVLFNNGLFTYAAIIIVIFLQIMLFLTIWGLRTRAVGENPSAADTSGINVQRTRFINVTLAGGLAGVAGAYLSLEAAGTFERGFTAGRGFTALAIMIFGAWNPVGAFAAALFFGLTQGVASQLQADEVVDIPPQFINMLPYVLTIVLLAVVAGRVRPPAAVGKPYEKD
ncbi:MAG: ABC transporter permease [Candidatus Nanopelagicales bacterium]|nr:ABC transporter permease [Candidatus Nanopelagicales bacterium]